MKNLFLISFIILTVLYDTRTQGNCISVPPAVCQGDCINVTYTGSQPPTSVYTWTSTCGTFSNPNQQQPGQHCFNIPGLCTLRVIVQTPGLTPDTCIAFVEVSPAPNGSISGNAHICIPNCAVLTVNFTSGTPPFIYQIDDGSSITFHNATGFTANFTVCPLVTTTYTLQTITDGSNCTTTGPFNSATITVQQGITASVTQTGNMLCAYPPGLNYAWWDCGYNQFISFGQCVSIDQNGCYCVIVSGIPPSMCNDTVCADYSFCDLGCSLDFDDTICAGDSVIFAYTGNASVNATFNWIIDVPGFPGLHFVGNDTVILQYDQPGCYHVSLTVQDGNCMATCTDSVCVFAPKSEATICCYQEYCDTCTIVTITLSGAPPWTAYITDGTNVDTIANILTSPYLYTVCPPADSAVTYTLLEVTDSCHICPATLYGDTSVTILLHPYPQASVINNNGTLCALPLNMAGYGWYFCPTGGYISTAQCFTPAISGCYCVDVSTAYDCVDTACFDIVVGEVDIKPAGKIAIYPNPSHGSVQLYLSPDMVLPAHWEIFDTWGRSRGKGIMDDYSSGLAWNETLSSGLYFLKIFTPDHHSYLIKVLIE